MHVLHWRALGARVDLLTDGGDSRVAQAAVVDLLDEADRTYSRFRPDSELRRLEGRRGPAILSPLLARAIDEAIRAARITEGDVDPTVGTAMRALGYDDDFALIAGRAGPPVIHLGPVPGWQALRFDARRRLLEMPAGVELDLGSVGKALAAELAADRALEASGARGVLVGLGGDLAIAGEAPRGGWRTLVTDASDTPPDADGEVVALRGGGMATSSTTVRRWTRSGVEQHHLVDPRTGTPVQGPWRTATVLAARCVDANIAATAAIVRGAAAPDWLSRQGLASRLVTHDGSVIRLAGWPAPGAPQEAAQALQASGRPSRSGR
jgi:FAD:protein FMN transferase